MLKPRFHSVIRKADLRHRSFYLRTSTLISSHRSSLLLFLNKGLVSLHLGKSISNVLIVYDSQMIYCNNGQLQIEQKTKKKILRSSAKKGFKNKDKRTVFLQYKWTNYQFLAWQLIANQIPNAPFNSYWALNTTRSHLPTSKRANCCMQK